MPQNTEIITHIEQLMHNMQAAIIAEQRRTLDMATQNLIQAVIQNITPSNQQLTDLGSGISRAITRNL